MRKIGLAALVAIVLMPAAAIAQPYEEETAPLAVSDTSVSPGGSVTLSGSGFAPDSEVEITIESTPRTLATVTADSRGEFSATVRIPSDLSTGTHTLKATGVTPDGATLVLSSVVSIAGSGTAFTGAPIGSLAAVAAGFLLIGLAAVTIRRRSRL